MTTNSLEHLHHEFRDFIERQPYSVTLDGLRLTIDKDVFPPDMGLCAQNFAHISQRYEPERALDMGCGTAYLALMLKMSGVSEVWAMVGGFRLGVQRQGLSPNVALQAR